MTQINSYDKKTKLRGLIIFVLTAVVLNYVFMSFYENESPRSSRSISESKTNGHYLGTYSPLKQSFYHKGQSNDIPNIWYEKAWGSRQENLFSEEEFTRPGFTATIPTSKRMRDIDYMYKLITNDQISGQKLYTYDHVGWQFHLDSAPDTVSFMVQGKKDDSWMETIIIDTISFVKD